MRKQIPNIITLMNLLCGALSILSAFIGAGLWVSSLFIILGAIMDFFDGFTARLLKVSSPIGKELDSLSDVVTFGLSPSIIAFLTVYRSFFSCAEENSIPYFWATTLSLLPLLMVLMSAYRLAKFNLDERQTSSFIGLATPANAFFFLSIPLIDVVFVNNIHLWGFSCCNINFFLYNIMTNPYFIVVMSLIMSVLLISEIPMFSLKFHNFSWQDNRVRFIFLIVALVLIILLNVYSIPLIIVCYIIISIIDNILKHKNNEV